MKSYLNQMYTNTRRVGCHNHDKPPPYDTKENSFLSKLKEFSLFSSSPSSTLDRKSLSQGVKLVEIAVEEFESGNEAIALDIYLSGLDKIIMALPNLNSLKTKQTLAEKLTHLQDKLDIIVVQQDTKTTKATLSYRFYQQQQEEEDYFIKFKILGQSITDIIVQCVVLFKRSPIPGFLYLLFSFFVYFVIWLDTNLKVSQKFHNITIDCIKYLLKIDEKYHLHEYASESIHLVFCTFLRIIIEQ